jgi:hypothetical protein
MVEGRDAIDLAGADDALGDEQAGDELEVVTGGSHGHHRRRAGDPQLERRLDGEAIAIGESLPPGTNAVNRSIGGAHSREG